MAYSYFNQMPYSMQTNGGRPSRAATNWQNPAQGYGSAMNQTPNYGGMGGFANYGGGGGGYGGDSGDGMAYQLGLLHEGGANSRNYLDNWVSSQGNNQNYDLGLRRTNNDYALGNRQIDVNQDLGIRGYQNNVDVANINTQPQLEGVRNQQSRFGQVFPWVQGMVGGLGQLGGGEPAPQVDTSPIFNQQQETDLVNQAVNQNAVGARTQMNQMDNEFTGRGFGASPLSLAALHRVPQTQQMIQNMNARTSIPIDMRSQNAQHVLDAQGLNLNRWNLGQQNQIGRYNAKVNAMAPFLSMLGQYA